MITCYQETTRTVNSIANRAKNFLNQNKQVKYTYPSHFGIGSMQLYVQAEEIDIEPTQLSKEEIEIFGTVVIDNFVDECFYL